MPGMKPDRERKIQRGLSVTPTLNARIKAHAVRLNTTWNEAVERVLDSYLPADVHIPNAHENIPNTDHPVFAGVDLNKPAKGNLR